MMNTGARAWSLIAIQGRRQYGGNQGYDDDIASTYRYDSDVANCRQMSRGDLVLLRNRESLLGIGIVERILSKEDTKKRFRCPKCRVTAIKERSTLSPRWRCKKGHTFADTLEEEAAVTCYEAHYGNSYIEPDGQISASEIKSAVLRPSPQASIVELSPEILERILVELFPASRPIFSYFVQGITVMAGDAGANNRPGLSPYSPSLVDERRRVLRSIRERRGQSGFRRKLIKRYGPKCMISGCTLLDAVEAAHIWPYRGPDDNHPDNGLLLRADLHTLFDLDFLGIHPETLHVSIAEDARQSGYARFDMKELLIRQEQRPSSQALRNRWRVFSRRERVRQG